MLQASLLHSGGAVLTVTRTAAFTRRPQQLGIQQTQGCAGLPHNLSRLADKTGNTGAHRWWRSGFGRPIQQGR